MSTQIDCLKTREMGENAGFKQYLYDAKFKLDRYLMLRPCATSAIIYTCVRLFNSLEYTNITRRSSIFNSMKTHDFERKFRRIDGSADKPVHVGL